MARKLALPVSFRAASRITRCSSLASSRKGLPVFRAQASDALPGIDLDAVLRLEQESLIQEDHIRAGLPS